MLEHRALALVMAQARAEGAWSLDDTRQVARTAIWLAMRDGVRDPSLLARIARCDVVDALRVFRGRGRQRMLFDRGASTVSIDGHDVADSRSAMDRCEAADELGYVRARLTQQEWDVVWRRYALGWSGKEVARSMQVSEPRVSSLIYRAARKLGIAAFVAASACVAPDPYALEALRLVEQPPPAVTFAGLPPARVVELGGGVPDWGGVQPILKVDRPVLGRPWRAVVQWPGWWSGPGALLAVGTPIPKAGGSTGPLAVDPRWLVQPQVVYPMPGYVLELQALPMQPFDLLVQALVVVDTPPFLLATQAVRVRGGTH